MTVLCVCVLVLLLPWKLNGTLTLNPSVSTQHEVISEGHGPSTRGHESTVMSTRDHAQITQELRSEDGAPSSKWPSTILQDHHITGESHTEHKITETQIITEEKKSTSHLSSLGQLTKRSSDYTSLHEDHGPSTRGQEPTVISTRNHDEDTTGLRPEDSVLSSKMHSQITQDQQITGMSHTENKTTEVQITVGESESPSDFSSSASSKGHTKRSLDYSQNSQTTSTPTEQTTLMSQTNITTGDQHQTSHIFKSTNKTGVTDNQLQEISRSTVKIFNLETNHTNFQTSEVITYEPRKVSAVPQTNMTTKWSKQTQGTEGTKASPSHLVPYTTNTSTNLMTTSNKTNPTAPAVSTSTMEVITTKNQSMIIAGSSTGLISTVNTKTVTTATATMDMKTDKTNTRGMTTSTTTFTTFTTRLGKKQTAKKNKPETSNNSQQGKEKQNKNNAGPIVAALIGSVLVLMLIAIVVILAKRHRMHKKKLENPDWAGPSPFLEGDTQHGNGEDGPFQRRDTKRISLHSFFPQRLSQRLSLLVEEEVQMNEIAVSSTFGKNEQPQNGKPAEEQEQIQTQKTANQVPAPEASADSTVTEMVTGPAVPDNNANIKPTSKPDDETIPSPSSQTNTVPPRPYEDVDLNPPQTNAVDTPPAPPLP
ncbi:protein EVI2B [Pygocentrus nattereri]|uniref:protein EVI2B n=1 Tax=Pygocentrus nattereri TaxID=42514 RepID=UPI0008142B0E|nr:protein EVI2B [Pygocentrus nattereri]XP_017550459.1 protein EVI2B [Pygocentrus nattereri]